MLHTFLVVTRTSTAVISLVGSKMWPLLSADLVFFESGDRKKGGRVHNQLICSESASRKSRKVGVVVFGSSMRRRTVRSDRQPQYL